MVAQIAGDAILERLMPSKTSEKKANPQASKGGRSNALQKPLQPSEALAAVVGSAPLPRGEVVSKVWDYIKSHKLQGSVRSRANGPQRRNFRAA
jgi:upstream activation factor subunit UAF30